MSLLSKLKKAGTIKEAAVLGESAIFNERDMTTTDLPILNIALSGLVDGGLTSGITIFSGMSKTFKTLAVLLMLKSYLDKYPDGICLFYDCEFGVTQEYLTTNGIDASRVIHIPILDIEEWKFDIVSRLKEINRGDKVFIMVDSLGAMASKKEVIDAEDAKSVGDMSRAKSLRGVLRIITPHITMKNIPMVAISNVYQTQEMYSKTVVGGGCMVEGTKVTMSDGTLREIQDVNKGDLVETLLGPKEVTDIWNPDTLFEGFPECYEVTMSDGTKVIVSENHQFLTDDGYVAAAFLKNGVNLIST